MGVSLVQSAVEPCIPSSGLKGGALPFPETPPGRDYLDTWTPGHLALPTDSHFIPRVENELRAAMQINPNGFPPAFTLLRVPLTGVMMINEKCFAPLHSSTNAE